MLRWLLLLLGGDSGRFIAYNAARVGLYLLSFVVYLAAQIHDEQDSNSEVFVRSMRVLCARVSVCVVCCMCVGC